MYRTNKVLLICGIAFVSLILVAACSRTEKAPSTESNLTIQVISPAFAEGAAIPAQYTCDGENISPPLKWSGVPQNARSLALITDDPDAPFGTFVHWVIYSIPPASTELAERVPSTDVIPDGAKQGTNDFKHVGYGGPCPPGASSHRYFFKLYALDAALDLKPGLSKQDLLNAMQGHILAQGQLRGTYKRQ